MTMFPEPTWPPTRTLVVIAHPDDEVLGCGGTIRKLADGGNEVKVLLPVRRAGARAWSERLAAFEVACARLGATAVVSDTLFDATAVESRLHELHDVILPWVEWSDTVLTHWHGDANQVHRGVCRAVELATRPFRRRRNVYLFEVPSSTDQSFSGTPFLPNTYVSLTDAQCELKCAAMQLYPDELAPGRRPCDLRRRMEVRGAEAGMERAEAFVATRLFY